MALKWPLNLLVPQLFGHRDNVNKQSKGSFSGTNEGQVQGGFKGVNESSKRESTQIRFVKEDYGNGFQMPLHYPRYTKADYQKMEEWKVDSLLKQYGLSFEGTLDEKRAFAMGTFLWPDQL